MLLGIAGLGLALLRQNRAQREDALIGGLSDFRKDDADRTSRDAYPLPFSELRTSCRVRTATLYERLAALTAEGRLVRSDDGYQLIGRQAAAARQSR